MIGSRFWQDQRTFRDYLRAHPDAAAAYGKLKNDLMARYPRDREEYIEGKTAFVEAILAAGRALAKS